MASEQKIPIIPWEQVNPLQNSPETGLELGFATVVIIKFVKLGDTTEILK